MIGFFVILIHFLLCLSIKIVDFFWIYDIINLLIKKGGVALNCPKCGTHISTFNLKPNCEKCGVNILLYVQEYQLERDAKRAELEFASTRIVLAKVRAAFIGGALPIARLVITLLCVAALLIPFADFSTVIPVFSTDISLSGLGIYNLFSGGQLPVFLGLAGSTGFSVIFGKTVTHVFVLIGIMLLIALAEVGILLAEILSFINIKKSAKAMCVLSVIGIVFCAAFAAGMFYVNGSVVDGLLMNFKLGFGSLVTALMLAANFYVNYKIYKNDLPLKLRTYDLERKETLKKVKSGEIDLDDLPIPVYETEEEKEARFKELEEMLKTEEGE